MHRRDAASYCLWTAGRARRDQMRSFVPAARTICLIASPDGTFKDGEANFSTDWSCVASMVFQRPAHSEPHLSQCQPMFKSMRRMA